MSERRPPVFLERDLYRKRRVIDGAKLLPWVGIALFISPVLLLDSQFPEANRTSVRLLFFFGAWASLIAIAFVLSRWLQRDEMDQSPAAPDTDAQS